MIGIDFRKYLFVLLLIVLLFRVADNGVARADEPQATWQSYSIVRRQMQTVAPASIVKLEFFGQMLLGCYPGSIIVKDRALIDAFVGALKQAEYRKNGGKSRLALARAMKAINGQTLYPFTPESAAGIRLYVRRSGAAAAGPTNGGGEVIALTFPFVPGNPELCYGPRFLAASRLLGPSYVANIRTTVQREASNIVSLRCDPLGIEDASEPPIRDPERIHTILTALEAADERVFSACQATDLNQRCLAPRLTLVHKNGQRIPIFLVIAVPDDPDAAPEWLRTLCDEVNR